MMWKFRLQNDSFVVQASVSWSGLLRTKKEKNTSYIESSLEYDNHVRTYTRTQK